MLDLWPRFTLATAHSAARRLEAAHRFVSGSCQDTLIVGATRTAADDFARTLAAEQGATFGLVRASLKELVLKLSLPVLSARQAAPASRLSLEALVTRVIADATADGVLSYLGPIATRPGFRRALLSTVADIKLSGIPLARLATAPRTGPDLHELVLRLDAALATAGLADYADLLEAATEVAREIPEGHQDARRLLAMREVVLLDLAVHTPREQAFIDAFCRRASAVFATAPAADLDSIAALERIGGTAPQYVDADGDRSPLARVQRTLFDDPASGSQPPSVEPFSGVIGLFAAPGEAREAVEIARRALREAEAGVPFDQMAVVCGRRRSTRLISRAPFIALAFRHGLRGARAAPTRRAARSSCC